MGLRKNSSVEYHIILGLFIFQIDSLKLIQAILGEEDAVRFLGLTGSNI